MPTQRTVAEHLTAFDYEEGERDITVRWPDGSRVACMRVVSEHVVDFPAGAPLRTLFARGRYGTDYTITITPNGEASAYSQSTRRIWYGIEVIG